MRDSALADLAAAHGIATEFEDWRDRRVDVPDTTLRAVLQALGVDVDDPAATLARERDAAPSLPACLVVRARSGAYVALAGGSAPRATVSLEDGGTAEPVVEHDGSGWRIPAGDLPLGYHRLTVVDGDEKTVRPLIIVPDRLELPYGLDERAGWGLSAQLYSVRSASSWGVGDLGDLRDLAMWAGAEHSADFVLVNPLHAAEPVAPLEPSPYLPASRRFFHPLFLRVEHVADAVPHDATVAARIAELADAVRTHAAGEELIDRDASWTAKRDALRLLFAASDGARDDDGFAAFLDREGDALVGFARWSAIAVEHGADARAWPAELRDADGDAVAAYARDHDDEVRFASWLQWRLDEQLAAAQSAATDVGMRLGTMHDLAVGVHPGGADAWRMPDVYAPGLRVGAPPDAFNQQGQDWGQPPWRPDRLAEAAYEPFRDLIRAVLRHAGGVRIDHIIGLFRLWWIPEGEGPDAGTYVYYDHEALVGILALEIERAGAVAVGEDLGVVEASAREHLAERGVLGTSILWFERDEDGDPIPAPEWRELCLASVTTHDLPPTAGYLDGEHLRLRGRLGLLSRPIEEETAEDERARAEWLETVRRDEDFREDDVESTVTALHRYLAHAPSRLLNVALTDAVGDVRVQNQPGTDASQYPNWRIPLSGPDGSPIAVEEVRTSARAAALADAVNEAIAARR